MNQDDGTSETTDETAFERVFVSVMNHLSDEPVDVPEETVYAYLSGAATPEQYSLVVDALSRSKVFRTHLLSMAEEMERVESPAFAKAFHAAKIDPPPQYQWFLVQRWLSRLLSWVRPPQSPNVRALAAVIVTAALLGYPTYRGLFILPDALEKERAGDLELASVRESEAASQREVADLRSQLEGSRSENVESARDAVASTEVLTPLLSDDRSLGGTRGSPLPTVYAPRSAAGYLFGFAPQMETRIPDGVHVALEISNASGDVKGLKKLTPDEVKALNDHTIIGETGLLTVGVLADDAPPGRYRVVMKRTDSPIATPLWSAEFELRVR